MIRNLFSSFDPSSSINLRLNWLRTFLFILILPLNFWLTPSRLQIFWICFLNIIITEIKSLLNKKFFSNIIIFFRLILLIIINNFIGLFPYIFTRSRHLIFRLSISLPLWIRFIWFGWLYNTNHIFIHIIPQGTPNILIPFIVLIETISNIIRPWTLSIRLSANIIAGHLLLTLLGNTETNLNLLLLIFIIIIQNILFILEISVSLIQAYVFSILRILYSCEPTN